MGEEHNDAAKIRDGDTFWHRLGDVGYFDGQGRFWYCGRKSQRVETSGGTLFTIPCEAIFNTHRQLTRCALVGLGTRPTQVPAIITDCREGDHQGLHTELRELGAQHETTRSISTFLRYGSLPVDVRHNSKIDREALALWAANRLDGDNSRTTES